MKKIMISLTAGLLAGCMNTNMNKKPNRWVTVLDADTGKPAVGVPLVYTDVKKPYLIVGRRVVSREYTTDDQGRAHVPAGTVMRPSPDAGWVRTHERDTGKTHEEITSDETIYLRTYENHMKRPK
jgi:hypothetical protein